MSRRKFSVPRNTLSGLLWHPLNIKPSSFFTPIAYSRILQSLARSNSFESFLFLDPLSYHFCFNYCYSPLEIQIYWCLLTLGFRKTDKNWGVYATSTFSGELSQLFSEIRLFPLPICLWTLEQPLSNSLCLCPAALFPAICPTSQSPPTPDFCSSPVPGWWVWIKTASFIKNK